MLLAENTNTELDLPTQHSEHISIKYLSSWTASSLAVLAIFPSLINLTASVKMQYFSPHETQRVSTDYSVTSVKVIGSM